MNRLIFLSQNSVVAVYNVDDLCSQLKLCKPLTSHTVAVFEAVVTASTHLLSSAAVRPRSDTTGLHHTGAGKTDSGLFRRQVRGILSLSIFARTAKWYCQEFLLSSQFCICSLLIAVLTV